MLKSNTIRQTANYVHLPIQINAHLTPGDLTWLYESPPSPPITPPVVSNYPWLIQAVLSRDLICSIYCCQLIVQRCSLCWFVAVLMWAKGWCKHNSAIMFPQLGRRSVSWLLSSITLFSVGWWGYQRRA